MKKYKAVIFDMDGVLIHSETAMKKAMIAVLNKYGANPDISEFAPYSGMGEAKAIEEVASKYSIKYDDSMKTDAYELYGGEMSRFVNRYENIPLMLETLRREGYILAVASSADNIKVDMNLALIGIERNAFDIILCGSDIEKKKPDPEIYIKTSAALGISPKDCVVIEDAVSGVEAARGAGMECIGVLTTYNEKSLMEAGCITTVDKTYKICNLLGEEIN